MEGHEHNHKKKSGIRQQMQAHRKNILTCNHTNRRSVGDDWSRADAPNDKAQ